MVPVPSVPGFRRQGSSHITLQRSGYADFVWAFHDRVEIDPKMLARIAKHTGLRVEDLWCEGDGSSPTSRKGREKFGGKPCTQNSSMVSHTPFMVKEASTSTAWPSP
jgi:hypothetical protein